MENQAVIEWKKYLFTLITVSSCTTLPTLCVAILEVC